MSSATRCPACGTVFRVVRDQLKVSEGWVRCGRCAEVFNAGQRLFDLEQDRNALVVLPARAPSTATPDALPTKAAPADAARAALTPLSPATARVNTAWAPPSEPAVLWAPESKPLPLAASPAPPAMTATATATAPPAAAAVDAAIESFRQPLATAAAQTPVDAETVAPTIVAAAAAAWATPEPAAPAELQSAQPETVLAQEPAAQPQAQPEALPEALPHAQPADQVASEAQATPGFVLRADRAAHWRHPARRSTLALLSLLLVALLAAQMALHYRDSLAAGWPATRPWLQAACNALGCRIEAPRRIDSLSVDSSGLVRVEGSQQYRLSLVLQNRASTAVRMPAIDLALTDTQGQTMARRVLTLAELGQPGESLPARGEVVLQAMLELGEQRVAGYTVELFYP